MTCVLMFSNLNEKGLYKVLRWHSSGLTCFMHYLDLRLYKQFFFPSLVTLIFANWVQLPKFSPTHNQLFSYNSQLHEIISSSVLFFPLFLSTNSHYLYDNSYSTLALSRNMFLSMRYYTEKKKKRK